MNHYSTLHEKRLMPKLFIIHFKKIYIYINYGYLHIDRVYLFISSNCLFFLNFSFFKSHTQNLKKNLNKIYISRILIIMMDGTQQDNSLMNNIIRISIRW